MNKNNNKNTEELKNFNGKKNREAIEKIKKTIDKLKRYKFRQQQKK